VQYKHNTRTTSAHISNGSSRTHSYAAITNSPSSKRYRCDEMHSISMHAKFCLVMNTYRSSVPLYSCHVIVHYSAQCIQSHIPYVVVTVQQEPVVVVTKCSMKRACVSNTVVHSLLAYHSTVHAVHQARSAMIAVC
jgi:hypothetical protein